MPDYLAPRIHSTDNVAGIRKIEPVQTSTAVLLGCAPAAPTPPLTPVAVSDMDTFIGRFGVGAPGTHRLGHAVKGFFANGGARLHVMRIHDDKNVVTISDLEVLDDLEDVSLLAAPGFSDRHSHRAMIDYTDARSDLFAVLDGPAVLGRAREILPDHRPRHGRAALYAPWLRIADFATGAIVECPPSGHVCGVFARTDAARGVHSAPADEGITGAFEATDTVSNTRLTDLSPQGINVLRMLQGGVRVWGARTLAEQGSEWVYVPVRRLITMIELSVTQGTQWAVSEDNDETLWAAIRQSVEHFLSGLWREGAIQGARPQEAFFVRCGEDTMSQADLDSGRLVISIGVAPLKPEEFVVIHVRQWLADRA